MLIHPWIHLELHRAMHRELLAKAEQSRRVAAARPASAGMGGTGRRVLFGRWHLIRTGRLSAQPGHQASGTSPTNRPQGALR